MFFQRKGKVPSQDSLDLSTPLLHWSREDAWTIGDAMTGTAKTGSTGSGNTSNSARVAQLVTQNRLLDLHDAQIEQRSLMDKFRGRRDQ